MDTALVYSGVFNRVSVVAGTSSWGSQRIPRCPRVTRIGGGSLIGVGIRLYYGKMARKFKLPEEQAEEANKLTLKESKRWEATNYTQQCQANAKKK